MGVTKYETDEERRDAKRISNRNYRKRIAKENQDRIRSILQRKSIGVQATILSIGGTLIVSNKGLLEASSVNYHPTFVDTNSESDIESEQNHATVGEHNKSDDWFEMSE